MLKAAYKVNLLNASDLILFTARYFYGSMQDFKHYFFHNNNFELKVLRKK